MTFIGFLQRLLTHAAIAGIAWMCAILALETLLPGAVTPFVNVPGAGIAVFALCVAAVWASGPPGRLGAIFSALFCGAILAVGSVMCWLLLRGEGLHGILLWAALTATGIGICSALFVREKP